MDNRRWMLCLGVVACLVTAGCMADEIVYVDQSGNPLAVDENGKPILPTPASATSRTEPVVAQRPAPAPRAPTAVTRHRAIDLEPSAPVASRNAPAVDPSWDLPTARAGATPSSAPARSAPTAKKVDSSAGLDSPPAGVSPRP